MTSHHYVGFVLVDRNHQVSAASEPRLSAWTSPASMHDVRRQSARWRRQRLGAIRQRLGRSRAQTACAAPACRRCSSAPRCATRTCKWSPSLGLRIRPERDFTQILAARPHRRHGRNLRLHRDGLMLSNSRFEDELILLGMLPDRDGCPVDSASAGPRPRRRPCRQATAPRSAARRCRSRDGRRRPPRASRASTSKATATTAASPSSAPGPGSTNTTSASPPKSTMSEAFGPLTILKRTFWGLLGLLMLSSVAIFLFTIRVARLAARSPRRGDRSEATRPVPARTKARRRRHGRRLQGPPRDAPPADGDQAARRRRGDRRVDRPLRTRGADHQPAHPPQHGADLRLRPHARRGLLLRDGVPRRDRPANARRAVRPAARRDA